MCRGKQACTCRTLIPYSLNIIPDTSQRTLPLCIRESRHAPAHPFFNGKWRQEHHCLINVPQPGGISGVPCCACKPPTVLNGCTQTKQWNLAETHHVLHYSSTGFTTTNARCLSSPFLPTSARRGTPPFDKPGCACSPNAQWLSHALEVNPRKKHIYSQRSYLTQLMSPVPFQQAHWLMG